MNCKEKYFQIMRALNVKNIQWDNSLPCGTPNCANKCKYRKAEITAHPTDEEEKEY